MPVVPQAAIDKITLLLISGISTERAEIFARTDAGLNEEQAREAVATARQRISFAAAYTRDEQIGRAIMRIESIYTKSTAAKDHKTALHAQRELNRLMGLYSTGGSDVPEQSDVESANELRRQLELVSAYLFPLQLTDSTYPVEEHARIA